jgi:hypothetical protein
MCSDTVSVSRLMNWSGGPWPDRAVSPSLVPDLTQDRRARGSPFP